MMAWHIAANERVIHTKLKYDIDLYKYTRHVPNLSIDTSFVVTFNR